MALQPFNVYDQMFQDLIKRNYSRADLYKECGSPGKAHPEQQAAELRVLIEMYKDLAPILTIEIGVWAGGTLYYWCKYATPETKIIAIDVNWTKFWRWISTWDITPLNLIPLNANSTKQSCKNLVQEILDPRDILETRFVFIDGGHDESTVRNDYQNFGHFVSNGIVSFHDISSPTGPDYNIGIRKLWQEITNKENKTIAFESKPYGNGTGAMLGIGAEIRNA